MIYVSGFLNVLSQEEQQREADKYAENGWELKDPSSHNVRIIIDDKDLDRFCDHLKSLPFDKKPRTWTDRNGETHTYQTVSFYMKGSAIAGNHIKLRAAIKDQQAPGAFERQAPPAQRPQSQPQSVERQFAGTQPGSSPRQPFRAPKENTWNSAPLDNIDEEIPF